MGLLFVPGAACTLLLFAALSAFLTGANAQTSASPTVRAYTPGFSKSDSEEAHIANGSYAAADQQSSYSPPMVAGATGSTQYIYNLDQQLTQIIQPGNVTITIGYDSAGRPSILTHPLGNMTTAYALVTGKLSQIGSSDGVTITYGYDGPLLTNTTSSGVISGTVHHTYNNDFNISSETVDGANQVNYVYDQDGLLTQAGALVASRDVQNGLLTGTTIGSVTATIGYNQFGEVLTYAAAYNGSALLLQSDTRDNGGRIAQRIETVSGITHTFVYTYDLAYRLSDVARDGSLLSHYSYSPNGNRTGYTGSSGTITATYDTQDRLLQYGNLSYTYSPNGELQSKTDTSNGQTTTYVYDALGNLRAVTLPGGTQISYVIDGNNRRVGKKVNGVRVQGFLYNDALEPVTELDASGYIISRFVYGTQGNVPDYLVKAGQIYFIISDNLGSPRLVVSTSSGQIAQRLDYDAFGNVTLDTNPGFQPFGFAGGMYDRDTGLVRFGARDYDSFTGRWTCKDPILFEGGSANLYAYSINDPINRADPSGLESSFWDIATSSTLDLILDATRKSDEEIKQEVDQRFKQERELVDSYNNKVFGPFASPKQAGFALWLLMSQLPSYLRQDASYSCSVRRPGVILQPGWARYKDDGTIHYPDFKGWDTSNAGIFIEIHVDTWRVPR
jgi:RHS repeat-associated protein